HRLVRVPDRRDRGIPRAWRDDVALPLPGAPRGRVRDPAEPESEDARLGGRPRPPTRRPLACVPAAKAARLDPLLGGPRALHHLRVIPGLLDVRHDLQGSERPLQPPEQPAPLPPTADAGPGPVPLRKDELRDL